MAIYKKLKSLRRGRGLSQQEMADQLSISQNAYSMIETGKTKIDEERIYLLADILRVHPGELLGLSDNKKSDMHQKDDVVIDTIELLKDQLSIKDEIIRSLLLQLEDLRRLSSMKLIDE